MKRNRNVRFGALVGTGLILSCVNIGLGTLHELSVHIPPASEVSPWRPSGASQFWEEDDLPDHMPDLAEIYREYGFRRAAYQSYSDEKGRTLRLELYEMTGPAGAYGLFTFKRGGDCESILIGDEACLGSLHLYVWKDRFLIAVVGPDSDPVSREELIVLAEATCDTIAGNGTKPDIVMLLPPDGVDETSIHYLMGSRALPSAYAFGLLDTFRVMEGVGGRIGENTVFLFRYSSEAEAERILPNVIARLSGPDLYRLLLLGNKDYESTESTRPKFVLTTEASYILMAAGDDISALSAVVDLLRRRVKSATE